MTKPLRVGIVGAGLAGNWQAGMFQASGLAQVVAACDVDEQRAQELLRKHGSGRAFHDYQALCTSGEVDAVAVATTNDMHYPVVMAALNAGLHVFCEKPLALTLEQAEEMTAAAHRAGVVHGVHFVHRTRPCFTLARRIIAAGHLGTIYSIRAEYIQDWLLQPPSMPLSARAWRTNKATAGSGVLGDLGAHLLDMLHGMVGDINAVSARLRVVEALHADQAADTISDDHAAVLLEFSNGALGQLTASRVSYGHRNHINLLIQGSAGALLADNERLDQVQVCTGPLALERRVWTTLTIEEREHEPTPVESFVRGIVRGEPVTPNFDDALWVQRVLDAAERSAVSGERVFVPTS